MIDYSKLDTIQVVINDTEYSLLVLKSEEEKKFGAQGIESLDKGEGLFFDYREEPKANLSFWMKDTTVPLDVIFVDDDDEVLSVFEGEPESERAMVEPKEVAYVIEVASGSGVKKGDDVDFPSSLEPNKMYVLNPDGTAQFELQGGERIFSRISSKVIIKRAKKAYKQKTDSAYKALGRYVFGELDAQTSRDPEYVKSRTQD